jgi:flagellar biosynthesis protein FlhG
MIDQAESLRKIISKLRQKQDVKGMPGSKTARIISVTSGKGGVGKTNISLNLAIALSEMNLRVVLIDADFGLANIDVLLGITPKYTLVDLIRNNRNIIEVLASGPNNIKFLSGGSGVEELIKLNSMQLQNFVNNISILDRIADIVLVDTGPGLSEKVMSILMATDEILVVTTPEPTSITDAYALIKHVSVMNNKKTIKFIVNRAENAREADDVINKLSLVADRFLSMEIVSLGYILQDDYVIKAVKSQKPFSLSYPGSDASKYIYEISKKLLGNYDNTQTNGENGIREFINRLVNTMRVK